MLLTFVTEGGHHWHGSIIFSNGKIDHLCSFLVFRRRCIGAALSCEAAAIREDAPQLHENVPGNITTIHKVRGADYP